MFLFSSSLWELIILRISIHQIEYSKLAKFMTSWFGRGRHLMFINFSLGCNCQPNFSAGIVQYILHMKVWQNLLVGGLKYKGTASIMRLPCDSFGLVPVLLWSCVTSNFLWDKVSILLFNRHHFPSFAHAWIYRGRTLQN